MIAKSLLCATAILLITPDLANAKRYSSKDKEEEASERKANKKPAKKEAKKAARKAKEAKKYRKRYVALKIDKMPVRRPEWHYEPLQPMVWIKENVPPAVATVMQDTVDNYLCDVYKRLPVKIDGAGNFTWKDPAAAARLKMEVCEYVIGGMHPDLREALYHFGQEADARGIQWAFLSGFRDNYRQKIAEGFKASDCGSMHGGSCRTKGYGDGRAADVWPVEGSPKQLFDLVDQIGQDYGLSRPMKSRDPGHLQVAGNWNYVAYNLRRSRYAQIGFRLPLPRYAFR